MSTGGREKSSLFRSLSKVLHRKSKSGSVGSIGISTHSSYHTSAHGQYTLLCPWSVHTPLPMVSTHPSVHGQYTPLCPWSVHTPLSMVSTHPSVHGQCYLHHLPYLLIFNCTGVPLLLTSMTTKICTNTAATAP